MNHKRENGYGLHLDIHSPHARLRVDLINSGAITKKKFFEAIKGFDPTLSKSWFQDHCVMAGNSKSVLTKADDNLIVGIDDVSDQIFFKTDLSGKLIYLNPVISEQIQKAIIEFFKRHQYVKLQSIETVKEIKD